MSASNAPRAAGTAASSPVVISIAEAHELKFWAMLLDVEPTDLRRIVELVGTDLAAIEREITRR